MSTTFCIYYNTYENKVRSNENTIFAIGDTKKCLCRKVELFFQIIHESTCLLWTESGIGALSNERRSRFIAMLFEVYSSHNFKIGHKPLRVIQNNCEDILLNVVYGNHRVLERCFQGSCWLTGGYVLKTLQAYIIKWEAKIFKGCREMKYVIFVF